MRFPTHFVSSTCSLSRVWLCIGLSLGLLITSSCNQDPPADSSGIPGEPTLTAKDPLLRLVPPAESGIDFQNYIHETFEMNITTHINTSNGGGVAILDINNDGLQDVYFISSSGENKMYLNEGDLKFKDITATSGLASENGFEVAVTVVDINADGLEDIYICRAGPTLNEDRRNKLYINNGDQTFSEQSRRYNLDDASASMGAAFFDFDQDGDLDLYLLNYPVDFSYASRVNVGPTADGKTVKPLLNPIDPHDTDRFYRNDGPPAENGQGGFVDISKEAGIWNFGYGLSLAIEDFNSDGWMDVYVANDFIQPDRIYINNRDGTFTDRLGDYLKHTTQHSMGTDLSDFDNDGLFDLVAVDMLSHTQYRRKTVLSTNSQNKYTSLVHNNYFEPVVRNVLQRNNGDGTFSDIACLANIFQTDWSWSSLMVDLDNDSWKDLLITNGYQREVTDVDFINFTFNDIEAKGSIQKQFRDVHDFLGLIPQYKLRNFAYQNNGDWTFTDVSGKWMTIPASWSNGAATADLDNDGDLDYLVNNINDPAFVYENLAREKTPHHYLQIKLKGPSTNPQGVGAQVKIEVGDAKQYQLMTPTKGIFSSVEHLLHFGLGDATRVDRVEVIWPDGKHEVLQQVNADQRLTLTYDPALPVADRTNKYASQYFSSKSFAGLEFQHEENSYIDFEVQFMLPWGLSELGPLMDTADVNGDGLTDFYVGNSFDKAGALYLQQPEGRFTQLSPEVFAADAIYEDQGAVFFDVDLDNDQDLLILSGGYESTSEQAWQPRLYINEGARGFFPAKGALPLLENVCLRAVAQDVDGDQDLDLIIGGRVHAKGYPTSPRSYVLKNERTHFVDATVTMAKDFLNPGMITDLAIANIDGDVHMELIVVGEWMGITVYEIRDGHITLEDAEELGLDKSEGFWNRLVVHDMDGDGDMDLVTGNIGLNTQYKPSIEKPIMCYAADYDDNGSLDPIITYYEGDAKYPLVQKDVLIKQVPVFKKKFVYSKDYARATIEDILSKEQIRNSHILQSRIVSSGWWKNEEGTFTFQAFPPQAQASIVQGMVIHDFNRDGYPDIFLAGNKYMMEVETGRLDAGTGTLLQGNGQGRFEWVPNYQSGIWADGNVRDIVVLQQRQSDDYILVVSNNNGPLETFLRHSPVQ